jgi:hypothetical protein
LIQSARRRNSRPHEEEKLSADYADLHRLGRLSQTEKIICVSLFPSADEKPLEAGPANAVEPDARSFTPPIGDAADQIVEGEEIDPQITQIPQITGTPAKLQREITVLIAGIATPAKKKKSSADYADGKPRRCFASVTATD